MNQTTTKRILELDLTKGLGVFLIPMAHTLLIYGTSQTQETDWLGLIVHFFGKWAGIFIISMGFSYALSNKHTIKSSIKRGLLLLGAGYVMNFLKFIVPLFLGLIPDSFIEAYGWTSPPTFNNMVYMILTGDILQFAGMCLLFMGIVDKLVKKFNKWIPIYIAIAVLVLVEFIRGFRLGISGVDYILDLLWGNQWNVYFPVFPWIGFILVGMFFGYWFKEVKRDIRMIFLRMFHFGLPLTIIGVVLCYMNYDFHMRDYFHLGIGGFIYLLGWNLMSFTLCYYLVKKYKGNKVLDFFYYCSQKITSIYIIQWVVICWGMGIFGYHNQTTKGVIPLMIVFTVITFGIQKIIDQISFKNQKHKQKSLKDVPV
ncbi:heparan-alpha-glucosaminide N-acetyltransferase domain-containing protein [Tenacibaculum agarivorans]|uniref:heparan-alpha-glucosaminide N-acetyltransferase domain-containing protein n=1 Tax=Tenacibaculum agarivorans TaxID=1908389 RepID=UPI00094BB8DB|nr:heparan-alpha-glucosaminide N-acetyltransferase domain-containing protein [Tenacibaculum agarivorans]